MADLFCRVCGEPWSAQGIHHSHTDMTWWEHYQLVLGRGCPCCQGKRQPRPEGISTAEYNDHLEKQWARSVVYASDHMLDPGELRAECPPWGTEYLDENNPPHWRMFDEVTRHIDESDVIDTSEDDTVSAAVSFGPGGPHCITFDGVSEGNDLVDVANGMTIMKRIEERFGADEIEWADSKTIRMEVVSVGPVKQGFGIDVRFNKEVYGFFIGIEAELENYPILDDGLFSELQSECLDEQIEKWAEENDEHVAALLGIHPMCVLPIVTSEGAREHFDALELSQDGQQFIGDDSAELIAGLLSEFMEEPKGWSVLASTVNEEAVILVPSYMHRPSRELDGVVVSWSDDPEGDPEVRFQGMTLDDAEIRQSRFHGAQTRWRDLPLRVQMSINSLINDLSGGDYWHSEVKLVDSPGWGSV